MHPELPNKGPDGEGSVGPFKSALPTILLAPPRGLSLLRRACRGDRRKQERLKQV